MLRTLSLFFLAILVPILVAQEGATATATETPTALAARQAKIIDAARAESQVMAHLDHLTNKIGPRLTSSDQLQAACEWAVEKFKSFGIKNARLEEWGTFPVGFTRGRMIGRMTAPKEVTFELTTPSWTGGTDGLVKGGVALAPADVEEAEARREELKGKWIVAREGGARGPSGSRETRLKLADIYAEAGVLGTIRPGQRQGNLVHTSGNHGITWETRPLLPQIIIRYDQWEAVVQAAGEGEVVLEFDIENKWREGPIKLYNVIADIIGSEFPDEYVVVGGHIDSWDGATGTTDNGTGTATTIEAARLLMASGVTPRRTIRFMLWSGEEQGLLGSWGWIGKNRDVLPRISAVLVHDGGTNYVSGIAATQAMKKDFDQVFAAILDLDPEKPFKVNETSSLPEGIGSDHDAFLREGVPGFFWNQAGTAIYNVTHHTQNDRFEAAIPAYQEHTSMVVACGALGIADLDHLLARSAMRGRQLGVRLDRDGAVMSVSEDSAAARAGIQVGDVFVDVNGEPVTNNRELRTVMRKGDELLKIKLRRGEDAVEVTVSWKD